MQTDDAEARVKKKTESDKRVERGKNSLTSVDAETRSSARRLVLAHRRPHPMWVHIKPHHIIDINEYSKTVHSKIRRRRKKSRRRERGK
jgi:hypothetical protein